MRPRSNREGYNVNGGDCIPDWPAIMQSFLEQNPHIRAKAGGSHVSLAGKSRYEYRRELALFPSLFRYVLAGKLRRQDGLGLDASPKPEMMYDFTYERSALATRFNDLAGIKAGLNARWRELENEAQRAGVPPGWLRP